MIPFFLVPLCCGSKLASNQTWPEPKQELGSKSKLAQPKWSLSKSNPDVLGGKEGEEG